VPSARRHHAAAADTIVGFSGITPPSPCRRSITPRSPLDVDDALWTSITTPSCRTQRPPPPSSLTPQPAAGDIAPPPALLAPPASILHGVHRAVALAASSPPAPPPQEPRAEGSDTKCWRRISRRLSLLLLPLELSISLVSLTQHRITHPHTQPRKKHTQLCQELFLLGHTIGYIVAAALTAAFLITQRSIYIQDG
jgi:hypothetical protein